MRSGGLGILEQEMAVACVLSALSDASSGGLPTGCMLWELSRVDQAERTRPIREHLVHSPQSPRTVSKHYDSVSPRAHPC